MKEAECVTTFQCQNAVGFGRILARIAGRVEFLKARIAHREIVAADVLILQNGSLDGTHLRLALLGCNQTLLLTCQFFWALPLR